jgi:predicted ATPase
MPLAIELAAACIAALGVEDLAARLDDRFRLLTSGHRTALPRHQTLRAALDWSYDLLSGTERAVLHRLAIFASPFTLEAASAVATTGDLDASAVVDGVANLAAKSLLVVEATGETTRYRLLETTRAYALEKLGESDDLPAVARRHAEYYRDLFERAEAECETRSATEWLATYGRQIDNIRAALDWTFSPRGDTSIGVALTAAAACLWIQQSLLVECRGRAERALASLGPRGGRDARHEMQLSAALGVSLMHTKGASADTIAAWTTALELAERLDDNEYQLRALWGLWVLRIIRGECRAALELADASPCGRRARPIRPIGCSGSGSRAPPCTTWAIRRARGATTSACSRIMSTGRAARTPYAFNTTRRWRRISSWPASSGWRDCPSEPCVWPTRTSRRRAAPNTRSRSAWPWRSPA